jgi:hypothetical protein
MEGGDHSRNKKEYFDKMKSLNLLTKAVLDDVGSDSSQIDESSYNLSNSLGAVKSNKDFSRKIENFVDDENEMYKESLYLLSSKTDNSRKQGSYLSIDNDPAIMKFVNSANARNGGGTARITLPVIKQNSGDEATRPSTTKGSTKKLSFTALRSARAQLSDSDRSSDNEITETSIIRKGSARNLIVNKIESDSSDEEFNNKYISNSVSSRIKNMVVDLKSKKVKNVSNVENDTTTIATSYNNKATKIIPKKEINRPIALPSTDSNIFKSRNQQIRDRLLDNIKMLTEKNQMDLENGIVISDSDDDNNSWMVGAEINEIESSISSGGEHKNISSLNGIGRRVRMEDLSDSDDDN